MFNANPYVAVVVMVQSVHIGAGRAYHVANTWHDVWKDSGIVLKSS